ncbi:MAG: cation diffusion facilitator family transporter [Actinomycetes bacterium]
MRHTGTTADAESVELYGLLRWGLATEAPMTVMFVIMAVAAGSSALAAIAIQSAVALVVNGFAVYAMRQVMGANDYSFPYGAGKLENFSAFLCGVLYVPSGLFVMFTAGERLIHAPQVGYLLSLIPVAVSLARGGVLYVVALRMARRTRNPSPLLVSYTLDYRIGLLTDAGVMISFALAWLLIDLGAPAVGDRINPIVALAISVYMLWVGVGLVRHNFRALMDLPLSEQEQMAITRVLAHHFDDYDVVGSVRSRASGKRRFVDVELGFDGDKTVEHVHTLSRHMERALAADVPGLQFRIVPVWKAEE